MKRYLLSITALALLGLCGGAFAADSGVETFGTPNAPLWDYDSTGDDSLTTLFASDNNFAGNSFDIIATNDISIVGWDLNLDNADLPTFTIDIYWKDGTANGFESTPGVWTHLGTEVVTCAGTNNKSHCNIGPLPVAAGQTVGIVITAQEAVSGIGGFNYTNGGPNNYNNADVQITTYRGLGSGWPPSGVFTYRAWNGCIHYLWDTPLSRNSWGAIKATF